ncbi:MAG: hypothetical protein LHW48_04075 [Candidatus Cloacimonetes bacterium]|nr:hypothetical protein [Candidatus Cloacimonadota bacterium]
MDIWLNPKYPQTMAVHAGKIRTGLPSTTIPEMGVRYKRLVAEECRP